MAFCRLSVRLWCAFVTPSALLRRAFGAPSSRREGFFEIFLTLRTFLTLKSFHISERWCSNFGSERRFGASKKMKILVFTAYERSKRVSTRCSGKMRNLKCQPFVLDRPRPPQNRHVSQISERGCSNFGLERCFWGIQKHDHTGFHCL